MLPEEYLRPNLLYSDSLLPRFSYTARTMRENLTGEYREIVNPTVPEYILFIGSSKHCEFMLNQLLSLRCGRGSDRQRPKAPVPGVEEVAHPSWMYCPLKWREYYSLVLGNLVRQREDRERLWDLIQVQIESGLPKYSIFLRLAIRHGNTKAVEKLLDLGWDVNGPWWAQCLSMTPYQLARYYENRATKELKLHAPEYLKNPRWGSLGTHKGVYELYIKHFREIFENLEDISKKNSELLASRGGSVPLHFAWTGSWTGEVSFAGASLIIYFIVLPLLLALVSEKHWAWHSSVGEKIGWLYIWSSTNFAWFALVVCVLETDGQIYPSEAVTLRFFFGGLAVAQHIVPLLLVTLIDWGSKAWLFPFSVYIVACCLGVGGMTIAILVRLFCLLLKELIFVARWMR